MENISSALPTDNSISSIPADSLSESSLNSNDLQTNGSSGQDGLAVNSIQSAPADYAASSEIDASQDSSGSNLLGSLGNIQNFVKEFIQKIMELMMGLLQSLSALGGGSSPASSSASSTPATADASSQTNCPTCSTNNAAAPVDSEAGVSADEGVLDTGDTGNTAATASQDEGGIDSSTAPTDSDTGVSAEDGGLDTGGTSDTPVSTSQDEGGIGSTDSPTDSDTDVSTDQGGLDTGGTSGTPVSTSQDEGGIDTDSNGTTPTDVSTQTPEDTQTTDTPNTTDTPQGTDNISQDEGGISNLINDFFGGDIINTIKDLIDSILGNSGSGGSENSPNTGISPEDILGAPGENGPTDWTDVISGGGPGGGNNTNGPGGGTDTTGPGGWTDTTGPGGGHDSGWGGGDSGWGGGDSGWGGGDSGWGGGDSGWGGGDSGWGGGDSGWGGGGGGWGMSPLVMDTNKDGIVSAQAGKGVDINRDGQADGAATGGDKMLSMGDINHDNQIDGTEVFGDQTVNPFTGESLNAANGFEALKMIAQSAQQATGRNIIDNNGQVDVQELKAAIEEAGVGSLGTISDDNVSVLEDLGDVAKIDTGYVEQNDTGDVAHRQLGSFVDTAGETQKIDDVWFNV